MATSPRHRSSDMTSVTWSALGCLTFLLVVPSSVCWPENARGSSPYDGGPSRSLYNTNDNNNNNNIRYGSTNLSQQYPRLHGPGGYVGITSHLQHPPQAQTAPLYQAPHQPQPPHAVTPPQHPTQPPYQLPHPPQPHQPQPHQPQPHQPHHFQSHQVPPAYSSIQQSPTHHQAHLPYGAPLQPHQSHQPHQPHQPHQSHQPHQPHQPPQSHQPQQPSQPAHYSQPPTQVVRKVIHVPKPPDTYSAACCLPYFPLDAYGNPHVFYDEVLFDTCPVEKTPQALCDGATTLLNVPPPGRLQFAEHITPHHPLFVYDELEAKHSADVAIVSKGCCSNVYVDVRKGQTLTADCVNDKIGDETSLITSVFDTSVITAGSADIYGSFARSVVVGGDYLSGEAATIAVESFGGPYPLAGFVLAGTVSATVGSIVVAKGAALLAADDRDRVTAFPVEVLEDPDKAIEKISKQVCAMSQNIARTPPNAFALFGVPPVTRRLSAEASTERRRSTDISPRRGRRLVTQPREASRIEFSCSSSTPVCVFEVHAKDLAHITNIIFDLTNDHTVKINVRGRSVEWILFEVVDPVTNPIIWNFVDAEVVIIDVALVDPDGNDAAWQGSILCPHCSTMELTIDDIRGTVGMSRPDSVLIIRDGASTGVQMSLSEIPVCPPLTPEVTFCHCLCPNKHYPPPKPKLKKKLVYSYAEVDEDESKHDTPKPKY